MVEREKQTLIGIFVLCALALLVGGIVLFGSGRFYTDYIKAIMYFDGSVKGLNVGSPIMFQGVKIGTVSEISLIADLDKMSMQIPVVVAIESEKISTVGSFSSDKDFVKNLIAKGVRAQLQMQSIVTGQLVINLAFHPGSKVRLLGKREEGLARLFAYPEIPTIPSASQSAQMLIDELPLKDMLDKAQAILTGIDLLVNSPKSQKMANEVNKTLSNIRDLTQSLNQEVSPLAQEARQTLSAASKVINRTDQWVVDNGGLGKSMASDLATTLAELRQTFVTAQQTLDKTQKVLETTQLTLMTTQKTMEQVKTTVADERTIYQIQSTLREIGEAARSVRQLSDYLERNPESVLTGRPEGE